MCGITGYVGKREAKEIVFNGLEKLEYRGYDSAGIAVIGDGKIKSSKSEQYNYPYQLHLIPVSCK